MVCSTHILPQSHRSLEPSGIESVSVNGALQKKEQAAANAEGGQKKKKVTAAQLRVQKGKYGVHKIQQSMTA